MAQNDVPPSPSVALEILAAVEDGVLAFDRQSRCVWANAAAGRLLGAHPGELTGRPRSEVLNPASWPLPETLEEPCQYQRYQRKLRKWFDVRATPGAGGLLIVRIRDASGVKAAEQSLHRSEERLLMAAAAAQVGVLEWHVGRRQLAWANERAYEIFGYPPEEGAPTRDHFYHHVLHPEDVASFDEALTAAVRSGLTFSNACRIHRACDGELRWVEFSGRFERRGGGSPGRLIGVVADITERKRDEERLRQHAEELAAIMDIAPVAMLVSHDPECRAITRNRAANEVFGASGTGVYASERVEAGPVWRYFGAGRELRREELPLQRAAATGDEVRDAELEVVDPGGARRTFWGNARPLRGQRGDIRGAVAAFLDISRRRRAEEDLRRNQADLNRAQAVAHIGSWRLRSRDGQAEWSEELYRIFGIPAGTPIFYDTFLNAVHPDDREMVARKWKAALRGEPMEHEHRIAAGGGVKWVRAHADLTFDDQGEITDGFGTVQDITAHRQAEEALHRFELLAAHSRDIILFMRRDGRILEANAAAVKAYGYTREELLSLSVQDLRAPGTHGTIAAQMAEADVRTILFETVHRRKDGSTFPVEVSAQGADVGGARTLISVVRDITKRKLAEAAVREADNRLQFALEASNTGYWDHDIPTGEIYCSAQHYRIFGYPGGGDGSAWNYARFLEHVVPEDRAAIERVMRQGASGPGTIELEYRITRTDGAVRWIQACGRFLPDEKGAPRRMVGIVQDITARKQAEAELADAKGRQEILAEVVGRLLASEDPGTLVHDLARMVMERLDCQYFFHHLVERGRLHLNASCGFDEREVARIEWLDLGESLCGQATGQGTPIVLENIGDATGHCAAMLRSNGIQACAYYPLMGGGRVSGTLTFASRTKSGFPESDLALMQAVANHIAIAMERVRVQRALRESQALYRAVARGIPGGAVWVVDSGLRLLVAEGSLLGRLGMSRESLEGRTLAEIPAAPYRPLDEERLRSALNGIPAGCETGQGGLILWTHYVPLRDDAGRVVAAMALALDITERKRVEEQLRHAQKLESIGVLAGGVAHDFNNLLASIMGNASLARMEAPPAIGAQLDSIVDASEKAATLTRQLLAYAGKGRFQVSDVDLARVILSSADLIRVSIPKNIEFELDVPSELPPVRGDAAQMQQVVMNLVINAAEAIGPASGGAVSVRAGVCEVGPGAPAPPEAGLSPGLYVRLEVRDSGCGMDEETRARMFDPFFTTKFTGRGLGLAAVQGILRSHKGGIAVETAPGKGSTFSVFLPCSARAAAAPAASAPPVSGRPVTVLVVDDEPAVRCFAKAALERLGHTVLLADNGKQALEVLASSPVDLVLLDVIMPVIGGGEAAAEIQRRWPGVALLLTSGYNREEARRLGGLPGGLPFLEKPYTVQTLAGAIQAACAARA